MWVLKGVKIYFTMVSGDNNILLLSRIDEIGRNPSMDSLS